MEKTYQRKETHFILKGNANSNQKGLIKHGINIDEPNSAGCIVEFMSRVTTLK